MTRDGRVYSAGLIYASCAVYFIHLLDERFWGDGVALWATRHTSLELSNETWLFINLPSMLILLSVALGVVRKRIPEWAMLAVAAHLLLHGATRIAGTIGSGTVAPGFATGLSLCVPLAILLFASARNAFAQREVALAVAIGILSFQPLWHFALLAVLPATTGGA